MKSKESVQRGASFARGGSGHTVKKQVATPAKSGQVGKSQSPSPDSKRAIGGPALSGSSMAEKAKPGRTGVVKGK